ncbi:TetR/AcrR family transcriptional regulator [Mycobacterium sp. LTG2003]
MRSDASANRERLLAAAEQVFAAQGTTATLDDVAKTAGVGPATLYRRFGNKDALVREVLRVFFTRLLVLAQEAEREPPATCVDRFLETVGYELADKAGLTANIWGDLAPRDLVDELSRRSAALLARAQEAGAMRRDLTRADITTTVWAMRGIVQASRVTAEDSTRDAWRRHLGYVLDSFHRC